MATIRILTPARGVVAADGKPNPIPDKEQTMFTQVERERDEVSGKHLTKYLWQFEAVMTATDPLVCGGGAGGVLTFPAIPATARITDLYCEIATALVNDAGWAVNPLDTQLGWRRPLPQERAFLAPSSPPRDIPASSCPSSSSLPGYHPPGRDLSLTLMATSLRQALLRLFNYN